MEKRYTVTADFYLYAESDEEAKEKASNWAYWQRKEHDNQANVLEIHETPFASLTARKLK